MSSKQSVSSVLRIVVLVIVMPITTISCFNMGLPEHFAPLINASLPKMNNNSHKAKLDQNTGENVNLVRHQHLPRALLLFDGPTVDVIPPQEFFGHQYFLGFIPLTNLYMQHGIKTMALESAYEALQLKGFDTYITTSSDMQKASSTLRPELIIKSHFASLTLNAFDLLFFRNISVQAKLEMEFHSPYQNTDRAPPTLETVNISTNSFRREGHAITLSSILKRSLASAIEEGIDRHQHSNKFTKRDRLTKDLASAPREEITRSILIIAPPSFKTLPDNGFNKVLSSSYGFASNSPFSEHTIARIVQRGLSQGIVDGKFSVVTSSSTTNITAKQNTPVWELRTNVNDLAIESEVNSKPVLKLAARVQIKDISNISKPSIIFEKLCKITVPQVTGIDGYWVVTLEKAASQLSSAFMTNSHCL